MADAVPRAAGAPQSASTHRFMNGMALPAPAGNAAPRSVGGMCDELSSGNRRF